MEMSDWVPFLGGCAFLLFLMVCSFLRKTLSKKSAREPTKVTTVLSADQAKAKAEEIIELASLDRVLARIYDDIRYQNSIDMPARSSQHQVKKVNFKFEEKAFSLLVEEGPRYLPDRVDGFRMISLYYGEKLVCALNYTLYADAYMSEYNYSYVEAFHYDEEAIEAVIKMASMIEARKKVEQRQYEEQREQEERKKFTF